MENLNKTDQIPDGTESEVQARKLPLYKRAMRTKAFPLLVLFAVMLIVFSFLPQMLVHPGVRFFQQRVFWIILQDIAVPGLLTIGVGLLIVSGGIDLSTGAVGSLAGVILATGVAWRDWHWVVAIIVALVVASLMGLINAIIINELKLMPFVVTFSMTTVVTSISQFLSINEVGTVLFSVNYTHATLRTIGRHTIGNNIPTISLFVVALFIIYGIALAKSKFGRTLYLMGGNRAASRLAGINEKRISYFLFINCSFFAGLAGLVNAMRTGLGGAQVLLGDQFTGIIAAILGGISFGGGSGGLGGAFLGLVVIRTFGMGTQMSGITAYINAPASGALLLLALTFDYFNIKAQNKRVGA